MIGGVFLFGSIGGWLIAQERTQRLAVAAIESYEGRAVYEFETDSDAKFDMHELPEWFEHTVELVGRDHVANVVAVELYGIENSRTDQADDSLMEPVAKLFRLKRLTIRGTQISDEGLRNLAYLKDLRFLEVSCHWQRHKGLVYLKNLSNLQKLYLETSPVDDADLHCAANNRSLEVLDLSHTNITSAAGPVLAGFRKLRDLNLGSTKIDDSILKDIGSLESLEILSLADNRITGTRLQGILNLKSLKILYLNGTDVTDRGVKILAKLPALEEVFLDQTSITDASLAFLEQMPKCKRFWCRQTRVTKDAVNKWQKKQSSKRVIGP